MLTKLVLQSLCVSSYGPRREINRQKAIKNVSKDKSVAKFKCNAFVIMQTNRHMGWYSSMGFSRFQIDETYIVNSGHDK